MMAPPEAWDVGSETEAQQKSIDAVSPSRVLSEFYLEFLSVCACCPTLTVSTWRA